MRGDEPDPARVEAVLGQALERAVGTGSPRRVRVFGEMVRRLWAQGRRDAAIRLEAAWNDLLRRRSFRLLCAYPMSGFASSGDAEGFDAVCDEHDVVMPSERYTGLRGARDRLRYVARLEQRTAMLARESARRRALEDTLGRRDTELADLLQSSEEGVLDIDPEGTVCAANPAGHVLLGGAEDAAPRVRARS
jgi:PAS domain-containing protein